MKTKPKRRREVWINVDEWTNATYRDSDADYGAVYDSLGAARQNMRREGGRPVRFVEAQGKEETGMSANHDGERKQHWGDCTIYSALINGRPWDGICTCGYGWDYLSRHGGDDAHMFSDEYREKRRMIRRLLEGMSPKEEP